MRAPRFKLSDLLFLNLAFAGWFALFRAIPMALLAFAICVRFFVLLLFEMGLDDRPDRETRILYRVYRWFGFSGMAAWALQLRSRMGLLRSSMNRPPSVEFHAAKSRCSIPGERVPARRNPSRRALVVGLNPRTPRIPDSPHHGLYLVMKLR